MLEIVRDRSWEQYQTVLDSDSVDGVGDYNDFSDLTVFQTIKSQIRQKFASKVNGVFQHAFVCEVTITLSGTTNSTIKMSLTREQTNALAPGEYFIDIVASTAGEYDENLMEPEAILVSNRPTIPT